MPVKRPDDEGCCFGMRALFYNGSSGRPGAGARVLPTGPGFEDKSAVQGRIRDTVLDELQTLQDQLNGELAGAIERLTKADASEKIEGDEFLHADSEPVFRVGSMRTPAANDDIVDGSPRPRRTAGRRFTAAADGKDSLAEILKHVTVPASSAEETAENSSSDSLKEELGKWPNRESQPSFQDQLFLLPEKPRGSLSGSRRTSREESRKGLHARIEERLNEVHQHQVEEEKNGQEHVDDSRSDVSTPSCSSTTWRVDALDMGDRLAADAAAKKGSASVESIVNLVQTERERWESEKQGLEARLEELKEALHTYGSTSDPESDALKKKVGELRAAIKQRSRFGTWVCERHLQESDDEQDEEGELRNADKEELRVQLQQVQTELREARRKAGISSPSAGSRGGQPPSFDPQ